MNKKVWSDDKKVGTVHKNVQTVNKESGEKKNIFTRMI